MFPWFWFWAPQVHFPWSGAVSQRIAPNTSWFSDVIGPEAGDPEVERQAMAVASYGRQLGLLTEVLLAAAEQMPALPPQAARSLERLADIQADIETIKTQVRSGQMAQLDELCKAVDQARQRGGPGFELLARRLQPLLEGAGPASRSGKKPPR